MLKSNHKLFIKNSTGSFITILKLIVYKIYFKLLTCKASTFLVNERPQWAAYLALMSGRLIGMDEHPGVHPVGMG